MNKTWSLRGLTASHVVHRLRNITTVPARPTQIYPRGLIDRDAIGEATAQKLYDEHLAELA